MNTNGNSWMTVDTPSPSFRFRAADVLALWTIFPEGIHMGLRLASGERIICRYPTREARDAAKRKVLLAGVTSTGASDVHSSEE